MSQKCFNLYLTSDQQISGDNFNANYFINWRSFLPPEIKQFKVRCYFRSGVFDEGAVTPTLFYAIINSNLPQPYTYSTTTGSNKSILGIAHIHFLNGSGANQLYYLETPEQIEPFIINYPTNNILNIQLTDSTNNQETLYLDDDTYFIHLVFEPCY
jgi:hypothetical protein